MNPTFTLGSETVAVFSPNVVPILGLTAALLLYIRAVGILKTRGRHVGAMQRWSFYIGLLMIAIATQTFIDPVGEQGLLSLHMAQHLLIADLPAPLMLYGLRAPVIYFFWPKPILVRAARSRALRRVWSVIKRPVPALSIWLIVLYAWHVPAAYEAALQNRLLHDLEHISFALTGVLAWWPLMDPTHDRVQGRVWKAGYVFAARTIGGFIGIWMLVWPTQIYAFYGDRPLDYGVSVITDQQTAGGMMMLVDFVIVTGGVLYFLAKSGGGDSDGAAAQQQYRRVEIR